MNHTLKRFTLFICLAPAIKLSAQTKTVPDKVMQEIYQQVKTP
jgi:hypothetical protein